MTTAEPLAAEPLAAEPLAATTLPRSRTDRGPRQAAVQGRVGVVSGASAVALLVMVVTTVSTAPHPAIAHADWRSASVLLAAATGGWNLWSARRAFLRAGHLSAVGMLQLWLFFAFSWAAAEQCYRYEYLQIGWWRSSLDNRATFATVALLAAFQVLFFLAVGRDVPRSRFAPALRRDGAERAAGGPDRPARRPALLLVAATVPFVAARVLVFSQLGLKKIVTTMVTRTDYFTLLDGGKVNPELWIFSALFPVLTVSALCLAVRYAVPAVSRRAAHCYSGVLMLCAIGCVLSGGRGDLVFVLLTVLLAMRLHGFRTPRQLAPAIVPIVAFVVLLFLLSQARSGHHNALTDLADDPYVGRDYSAGDLTQLLGLGRFDAVRMIVSMHSTAHGLGAQDYLEAVKGALDSVFLPRIATGEALPYWHVSKDVMGPWIFGMAKGSSLPSGPGELYLAFGVPGVMIGAGLFGLVTRALLRLAAGAPGPAQITWVLLIWTLARGLTDESYLIFAFVAQNWPPVVLIGLLLSAHPLGGRAAPAPPARPRDRSAPGPWAAEPRAAELPTRRRPAGEPRELAAAGRPALPRGGAAAR